MTRPRYADPSYRALCLAAAEHLLAERERRYPALVEAGKMSAADSTDKLELARCLVAQWRWIADEAEPPCPAFDEATLSYFGAPDWRLVPDLRDAAERAGQQRGRRVKGQPDPDQLADLYAALAFLQAPPAGSDQVQIVTLTRLIRQAAARQRAECERRMAA